MLYVCCCTGCTPQEEQVFLHYSTTRLDQFGIKGLDLYNTLVQQNVVLPSGHIDAAGQDIVVEPTGNFKNVGDIIIYTVTLKKRATCPVCFCVLDG